MTEKVFIQIGTNNGNDNFRKLVIQHKPSKVILVEPNYSLFDIITEHYKDIPNVYIENKAIYYNSNSEISLYIPKTNANNIAANGCGYCDAHYSLVPMNDWGDALQEIKTDSITFDDLCIKYNIRSKIDYLQIDTEGFDTEILKMIDFNKYDIRMIRYEK